MSAPLTTSVPIKLENWEIIQQGVGGFLREAENIDNPNVKDKPHFNKNMHWQWHIEAALSEYALSKWLKLEHPGKGEIGDDDTLGGDVRWTCYPNGYLSLNKADDRKRKYWLVTGQYGKYVIVGWIWGDMGMRDEWWKPVYKHQPKGVHCYQVPQDKLVPANPPDEPRAQRGGAPEVSIPEPTPEAGPMPNCLWQYGSSIL